jgi:hypothetical protein
VVCALRRATNFALDDLTFVVGTLAGDTLTFGDPVLLKALVC